MQDSRLRSPFLPRRIALVDAVDQPILGASQPVMESSVVNIGDRTISVLRARLDVIRPADQQRRTNAAFPPS